MGAQKCTLKHLGRESMEPFVWHRGELWLADAQRASEHGNMGAVAASRLRAAAYTRFSGRRDTRWVRVLSLGQGTSLTSGFSSVEFA